jgi:hypothetical protein
MLKGLAIFAALAGAAALSGAASAQRGDPLGGQFGAIEIAMSPLEASKDVTLMSDALSKLPPQRPGVVDTYVISASLWNDPVFENEAKEAAAVLARRYDATERTIVLSAGRGAGLPRLYAAATPNNFNAVIGRIGQIIDPKEDLVVVFVTSHGGQDGAVAIQEKGRMGGSLRPQHLRASLQQANIGAKLVIVSACFSGHFVLPFTGPDTVLLTAAAADKTSFGCEPSRDWTFFGDALFNHALRGGDGVLAAFAEAQGIITKWEDSLHANWDALPPAQRRSTPEPQPSNPQSAAGDNAMAVIVKAEGYGNAVACAAHLSFALDRAKTGRPLKGLGDVNALTSALNAVQARATSEGQQRGRTPQDTGRAIAAISATTLQIFQVQTEYVTAHATRCMGP